jgi:hypothetical protein
MTPPVTQDKATGRAWISLRQEAEADDHGLESFSANELSISSTASGADIIQ